ncbi:two-component sensor histidine kinase [Streptacidiphilus sp. PB12-B1b]|uniref:sensor histidine kinase n=1 Tax=Streptacidiphilus sp. PB12-B1b TaxID=2705012 RepID=UPI0015F9015D|nr:histidine kinase [Streptacidiphilus sp. PB12-B1b]QMU78124.1 two-component sensor histidine kinase [Streptacidiphilus sp. PB12-B1b]
MDQNALRHGTFEEESAALVGALGRRAPAPRLASSIVLAVVIGYMVMGFTDIGTDGLDRRQLMVGSACFVGVAALQLVHSYDRLVAIRHRLAPWSLLLQAVLTYLPLGFGITWGGMAGFLGASGLLLLSPTLGWCVFGGVAVSAAVSGPLEGWPFLECVYILLSTTITSLIVFGLTRLAQLVAQVESTRLQLARMAVTRERLRFSRDLHDLLGYSLSAIALKSELTRRLVISSPEQALEELGGVVEISRQALADVRVVARGYRTMSLGDEMVSARSVLEAAEIHAAVDLAVVPPKGPIDTVLATVLREAVTNLLRHSKAERCRISCLGEEDRILLTIANDGLVPGSRASGTDRDGNGLANLTVRLTEIGGWLTWGVDEAGWFVLSAGIRLPAGTDAPGPDGRDAAARHD